MNKEEFTKIIEKAIESNNFTEAIKTTKLIIEDNPNADLSEYLTEDMIMRVIACVNDTNNDCENRKLKLPRRGIE